MSFTSCGFVRISMDTTMPFMQTLFPLPVEPATSKCGILLSSANTACPVISRPNATCNNASGLAPSFDSNTSRSVTMATSLLGTSIPIADFPGIGASIRISLAANANARSSCKLTILLTFTPISGKISYFVTAGPKCTCVTFAFTPKLCNVCSSFLAFA